MTINIHDYPSYRHDWDKEKTEATTKEMLKRIGKLHYKMYAEKKHNILIVLQGLDAAGKDGLTTKLLHHCTPIGLRIASFKKPTEEEYARDFLWRVHQQVPKQGELGVFIRSHYEDILVPDVLGLFPAHVVEQRYDLINDFERLLQHNNTVVLKFFLKVSPQKQLERLKERLTNPEKHWKNDDGDWATRQLFEQYMQAYDKVVNRCNSIPWHIVPADANWQKLYVVASKLLEALESMDMEWPPLQSDMTNKIDEL